MDWQRAGLASEGLIGAIARCEAGKEEVIILSCPFSLSHVTFIYSFCRSFVGSFSPTYLSYVSDLSIRQGLYFARICDTRAAITNSCLDDDDIQVVYLVSGLGRV